MSIPHPSAPKPSGIDGNVVPATKRPDGSSAPCSHRFARSLRVAAADIPLFPATDQLISPPPTTNWIAASLRKEIKVRPGYTPQEDVARYRSPRVARKLGHETPPATGGDSGLKGLADLLKTLNVDDKSKATPPPAASIPAAPAAAPPSQAAPPSPSPRAQPAKPNWRTGKGSAASIYAPAAVKDAVVTPTPVGVPRNQPANAPAAAPRSSKGSVASIPAATEEAAAAVKSVPARSTTHVSASEAATPAVASDAPAPRTTPKPVPASLPKVPASPPIPAPEDATRPTELIVPTASSKPVPLAPHLPEAVATAAPVPARKTSWGVHLRTTSWADEVDELSDPEFDDPPPPPPIRPAPPPAPPSASASGARKAGGKGRGKRKPASSTKASGQTTPAAPSTPTNAGGSTNVIKGRGGATGGGGGKLRGWDD